MTFFEWAQKAGKVFRYEIYNREGYSQLHVRNGVTQVNMSEFSADAVRSPRHKPACRRRPREHSRPTGRHYAQAYVPVLVNGKPVAIVAAYVDQTEKRGNFYSTFLVAAAALVPADGAVLRDPGDRLVPTQHRKKQRADQRIRFLAHHDALTGLANRAQLIEQLSLMLATLPLRGGSLAVHFFDLDRFKAVNDTLGHDGGDFLLKTIAERLRAVTRLNDVVARLGGDEFVVVQAGHRDKRSGKRISRTASRRFGRSDKIQGAGKSSPRSASASRWRRRTAIAPSGC